MIVTLEDISYALEFPVFGKAVTGGLIRIRHAFLVRIWFEFIRMKH